MQPLDVSEAVFAPEARLQSSEAGWDVHKVIVKETNAPESCQRLLGVRILRYDG